MKGAGAAVLFAVGVVTSLATVAVHQLWWGLVLGASATLSALLALSGGWLTRLPFAAGWTGFLAWMVPTRDEGDYAISADAQGVALLALALVVVVLALATLPRPVRRSPVRGSGPPTMAA